MDSKKSILRLPMDIHELQSKAMTIHEKHTINYRGSHFWDNSDLNPSSSHIPSDTKTIFHLNQAEDNGQLEKINTYHNPLSFTSNSDKIKLRCWDLGKIEFLSREGSTTEVRDHNEYELWIRSSSYKSRRNSIFDDIMNLE